MPKIKAIKHPQPEARPLLHIPFAKYTLWLADVSTTPYIPLQPVCDALGLNFKGQVSRLRRSKRLYSLKSVAASEEGKTLHLEAIPLENLSAFLFTLRLPAAPYLATLRDFEQQAARMLTFFWSRYSREYISPKAAAEELTSLSKRSVYQEEPVERRARITPSVISRIKKMNNSGLSISNIARQLRYSRTTVSLILAGKYKTEAGGTYSPS